MSRAQRVEAILSQLHDLGNLQVGELSERFGVSEATLRRDLSLLEQQDLLTRTHGGALAQHTGYSLPRTQDRAPGLTRAIGRLAALSMPSPEQAGPQVAAFTGGSLTAEAARQIASLPDLTVVTTSLAIAVDVAGRGGALLMLGGMSRPGSPDLSGPWTEELAARINVGTLFVQAEGFSASGGLTSSDHVAVRTTQALIARAERVVVLAPGAAIGQVALHSIAAAGAVDQVITDASASGPQLLALHEAGVTAALVPLG